MPCGVTGTHCAPLPRPQANSTQVCSLKPEAFLCMTSCAGAAEISSRHWANQKP